MVLWNNKNKLILLIQKTRRTFLPGALHLRLSRNPLTRDVNNITHVMIKVTPNKQVK